MIVSLCSVKQIVCSSLQLHVCRTGVRAKGRILVAVSETELLRKGSLSLLLARFRFILEMHLENRVRQTFSFLAVTDRQ